MALASTRPEAPDCSRLRPSECNEAHAVYSQALEKFRNVGNGWGVDCMQDRVTLERTCFAVKWFSGGQHNLRIETHRTSGMCLSAVLNNHPGKKAVIRIGQNDPIWYEGTLVCNDTAQTIIQQLISSPVGAARGNVWPNRTEEYEFDATGIEAALGALKRRADGAETNDPPER